MHRSNRILFDHLVGGGEQRRRNFEAERLGGFEIEDEVEFRRLGLRVRSPLSAGVRRPV
jgi:hypothetical protein